MHTIPNDQQTVHIQWHGTASEVSSAMGGVRGMEASKGELDPTATAAALPPQSGPARAAQESAG